MRSDLPLISIIVPIYNTGKYLSGCLDSIIEQSYRSLEILLIDDGSIDNSSIICDSYAEKDSRVRVFHVDNGGVSKARNIGLDSMTGDYFCFVDSDDYIGRTYVEDLYNDCEDFDNNILVLHNIEIRSTCELSTSDKMINKRSLGEYIARGDELIHFFVKDRLMRFSGPVAKLFQSKVIREHAIYFPVNVNMGEDAIFYCEYLLHTDALIVSNKKNYVAMRRSKSLTSTYNSFRSEWRAYCLWRDVLEKLINKYKDYFINTKANTEQIVWENTQSAFVRSVQSVFKSEQKLSLVEQVRTLKKIPSKEYKKYRLYYFPKTLTNRVNKFLISNKLFLSYCIVGRIYSFFYKKERVL